MKRIHTLQSDKSSDGPPDPPPPRARAHAKEDRSQRQRAKPDAQLNGVPRTRPRCAEPRIVRLTFVLHAQRELATCLFGVLARARVYGLDFAELVEAVASCHSRVQDFGRFDD